MKYTDFQKILTYSLIMAILMVTPSCGPRDLGNIDSMQRDGDGDPTKTGNEALLSDSMNVTNRSDRGNPSSSEDGVRVEIQNFGNEEWEQIKTTYQLEDRDPNDNTLLQHDREELALGTWEGTEDNRYQVVYSYLEDGSLWLRLRTEDSNTTIESEQQETYLTKEEAENRQLSSAWVEMVRTARRLEETFNNGKKYENTERSGQSLRR